MNQWVHRSWARFPRYHQPTQPRNSSISHHPRAMLAFVAYPWPKVNIRWLRFESWTRIPANIEVQRIKGQAASQYISRYIEYDVLIFLCKRHSESALMLSFQVPCWRLITAQGKRTGSKEPRAPKPTVGRVRQPRLAALVPDSYSAFFCYLLFSFCLVCFLFFSQFYIGVSAVQVSINGVPVYTSSRMGDLFTIMISFWMAGSTLIQDHIPFLVFLSLPMARQRF